MTKTMMRLPGAVQAVLDALNDQTTEELDELAQVVECPPKTTGRSATTEWVLDRLDLDEAHRLSAWEWALGATRRRFKQALKGLMKFRGDNQPQ